MAFFKFRPSGSKGDEQSAGPAETIDGMRRRARHRLIGAALLVLVGVVGFPLLFDTQPRPVAVDIPIDIPEKAKAKPLSVGTVKIEKTVETEEPAAKEPQPTAESSLNPQEEVVPSRPLAKVEKPPKPEPKPEPKSAHKPDDDAAKARALLDGKNVADAGDGRFIVQVGAFADAEKAREARSKLERAGLKTYTQVVDTKDGPRTRVRVGPFTGKAEAEKAASKIKGLALSASILAL
jgi:DedD protein